MTLHDVQRKGFHERFHLDAHGRRWDFVQKKRFHYRWGMEYPPDHPWNQGKVFWVCAVCKAEEPVKISSVHCDEVVVPDPTEQLSKHVCSVPA